MDIHQIEHFCDRWIEKASAYSTDSLDDLFDRYFTLFVAYNRIYSASAELYRSRINESQARMLQGDRREATAIMERFILPSRFSRLAAERSEISDACERISNLLNERRFFLHTNRQTKEPDWGRDQRLSTGLHNLNLMATLECLYQIRCNIFHGEKEFSHRQAELLIPAITLLESVVQLSREVLRENAQ